MWIQLLVVQKTNYGTCTLFSSMIADIIMGWGGGVHREASWPVDCC